MSKGHFIAVIKVKSKTAKYSRGHQFRPIINNLPPQPQAKYVDHAEQPPSKLKNKYGAGHLDVLASWHSWRKSKISRRVDKKEKIFCFFARLVVDFKHV